MKKPIKLKLIYILLFLISFFNNPINGQSKHITLMGVVVDSNSEPIPQAYIICRGINNYSYSDIDGKFSLSILNENIKKINEIWIGSPGYVSKRVNISKILNKNKFIEIQLEQESYLISEVTISARHLYDGKAVIKKAFKNINKTFINTDFGSEIHVVQAITENKTIKKYRESYLSVFHKSGYLKLLNSRSKIREKVYSGQIRETKDYSINKQQPNYNSISIKYWFFFYDNAKYKPQLIRELNNYKCYIIDSLKEDNLLLINCKQLRDTIAGKSKYKYKTDYLITVSLDNDIIRSITANTSFFYKEYSKNGRRRRIFSTLLNAHYTSFQKNNYLKSISHNFIDKVILNDTLGNIISNKALTISTQLLTKSVHLNKSVKIRNSFHPVYNKEFWKDKPLYYKRSSYCKEMFVNNKMVFLKK